MLCRKEGNEGSIKDKHTTTITWGSDALNGLLSILPYQAMWKTGLILLPVSYWIKYNKVCKSSYVLLFDKKPAIYQRHIPLIYIFRHQNGHNMESWPEKLQMRCESNKTTNHCTSRQKHQSAYQHNSKSTTTDSNNTHICLICYQYAR